MTGAGLPPIALEAVLKLLTIGKESAQVRKTAKTAAKPKLALALATPTTARFTPTAPRFTPTIGARTPARRLPQQRGQRVRTESGMHAHSEGADQC